MPQYQFNENTLLSLQRIDYLDEYNHLGLDDFPSDEQEIIFNFFNNSPPPRNKTELDITDLFTVKSKGYGIFGCIYEPTIYADGDELILKFNDNELPVQQTPDGFTCGNFTGYLAIAPKPINVKVEVDGQSVEKELWPAGVEFVADQNGAASEDSYYFKMYQDASKNCLTPMQMRQMLRKGEPLAPYLKGIYKGGFNGTKAGKLGELEKGAYPLVSITPRNTSMGDGRGWILELEDGRRFWACGDAKKQLKASYKVNPENMPTLVIFGRKPGSGDRIYVDCGLTTNPRANQTAAPGGSGTPTMNVIKGGKPGATNPRAASVNYEDIPF